MAQVDRKADLAEAAAEELERACGMTWAELAKVTPWGDTFEGFTPAGRTAEFERNYLWAADAGGDICVEVVVFQPQAHEQGVKLTRIIPRSEV